MIKISAPGKLFLAGEWAVLETGNPGIVAAVDRRVFAEVEERQGNILIDLPDFGIEGIEAAFDGKSIIYKSEVPDEQKKKLAFIKAAIEAALQYLGPWRPFRIKSYGKDMEAEIDGVRKKIGFGSSAAAVVACMAAVLRFNGMEIRSKEAKDVICKLSAIAHYLAQGKVGSGFDVAASTYGGIFVYQRFDPDWLLERIRLNEGMRPIVNSIWPSFSIEPLARIEGMHLLIGWTKESADTAEMIRQMDSFRNSDREEYDRIYGNIADTVREIVSSWKNKDKKKILELIKKNRQLLKELGEKSRLNIETEGLKQLAEMAEAHGQAGKLSGAGGGDCGIAFCFDEDAEIDIIENWERSGIYVVETDIDFEGVRAEYID
ncbi:MAG: phosphomevalonate kinase [Candidatus Aenigmarchaeota archaeon]|nr:phosphomevalonate kinase [Candidatus Aenigmarchaeota archaeon]